MLVVLNVPRQASPDLPQHHSSIVFVGIPLPLLHDLLAKPTTARIKLLAVLIPNLPTTLTTPILPSLSKSLIQIAPDNPLIELGPANVLHAVQRVLVRVVLDEAEAAGRLVEAVQAHDQALDAAALAEQLVDLFLGRVEGQVADVQRRRVLQLVDRFRGWGPVAGGWAALALVLLGELSVGFCFDRRDGGLGCCFEGCCVCTGLTLDMA